MSKYIPVNELVMAEMKKQGLRPADLARKLRLSNATTYYLLSRPTIQIDRLWQICVILKINFFKILSDQLGVENTDASFLDPEKEALKAENKTLKEIIQLLGGNK
jgi:DNA-binding Xre family transcriptional regulator